MATLDRPNNDGNKNNKGFDYRPKGAETLTMEQKFRLEILAGAAAKCRSKEKMFELLMDSIALNMNQMNTFRELMKMDIESEPHSPDLPSVEEFRKNIKKKKE